MNQTLAGPIGGTGPLTISSRGGAVTHQALWLLNAASTYTGNTTIIGQDGLFDATVKLGVTNALPTGTSLNLQGVTGQLTAAFTTLDLNGYSQSLAGLTDTGSSANTGGTLGKRIINSSATLATLTITTPNIPQATLLDPNFYSTGSVPVKRGGSKATIELPPDALYTVLE